eukprot:3646191-Pyramimonas_sp.AAC.1
MHAYKMRSICSSSAPQNTATMSVFACDEAEPVACDRCSLQEHFHMRELSARQHWKRQRQ